MKNISTATGIGANGDFLNGDLVDNQTLLDTTILQDIVQFFQKLKSKSGLTENGNFDNEANGYQTIESLDKRNFAIDTDLIASVFQFNLADKNPTDAATISKNYLHDITLKHARFFGVVTYLHSGAYVNADIINSTLLLDNATPVTIATNANMNVQAYNDRIIFNNIAGGITNISISLTVYGSTHA